MDATQASEWLAQTMPGFAVMPLQPGFGAEIAGLDLGRADDPQVAAAMRALWLQHRVILLRDQKLDRAGHLALATLFGEPVTYPFSDFRAEDFPTIIKILSDRQTADAWHCDLSYDVRPAGGAVLRAVRIPPVGGDTLFADGYAAYDALDEAMKARIETLHAIHDFAGVLRYQRSDQPGHEARLARVMEKRNGSALVAHPLVLKHPLTGRRTLFVNPAFCTRIIELEPAESDALMRDLYDMFMVPERQLRVRWSEDAVVVWENLSTIHYAAYDYAPFSRHMERITVRGERLYAET